VRFAIMGLGEAGQIFSHGLAERGADVVAFDPRPVEAPAGVRRFASASSAVEDADLVFSLVGASAADSVLESVVHAMRGGAVFADLNTASPDQKLAMASRAASHGLRFADVAVMAPVDRSGIDTPMLVSGDGAAGFVDAVEPYRLSVRTVEGDAGVAAGLKLLRSVFMKGLAGLVFEATEAAEKAHAADWMREEIASELGESGGQLVQRLITGTRLHAARRAHEMEDVDDYLRSLDSPNWMTMGTTAWLRHIASTSPQP
jgi:3-hydroxyisobutyrate dehydrogenase-like beta-hydroxyacid dehydrogenase